MTPAEREARRQQLLLQALWRDAGAADLDSWLHPASPSAARGLAAYAANAAAGAERALRAQFPTVAALVGDEAFAAMARAYWLRHPPERGDLAWLGDRLPAFIESSPQLAGEPYLADTARLDALLDAAERAADGEPEPATLAELARHDPAVLRLELLPGTALLVSRWPVVAIHDAHRRDDAARFDTVREALAAGRGETALVCRDGWRARARAVAPAEARWTAALLDGATLDHALDAAGEGFDFEAWLVEALREGRLVRVRATA